MAFSVQMPALGESVSEGTVTRWLKKEGDTVEVDEPLLEVSTDKVDTEIPSPAAGTLKKIVADEDETVEIGGELAVIDDGGDSGDSDDEDAAGDDAAGPDDAGEAEEGGEDAGSPDGTEDDTESRDVGQSAPKKKGSGRSGTDVTMPELGESVSEGTVTRWLKKVGDTVEVDEPLLEVSTDKVDTEIPSPVAGTLLEIVADEDDTVDVGGKLAVIGDADAASGSDSDDEDDEDSGSAGASDASGANAAGAAESSGGASTSEEKSSEKTSDSGEKKSEGSKGKGGSGTNVAMPELGESVTEGTVTRWLKKVGDTVEVDEPLLEVSTDKVDTEIPSPVAGTILEIVADEDDTIDVGGTLAVIGDADSDSSEENDDADSAEESGDVSDDTAGGAVAAEDDEESEKKAEAPKAEKKSEQKSSDKKDAPKKDAPKKEQPKEDSSGGTPERAEPAAAAKAGTTPYVTPLVRKLAQQHGVDLESVTGTGIGGRIRKQDVLAAAEGSGSEKSGGEKSGGGSASAPEGGPSTAGVRPELAELRGTTQKANRIRRITAKKTRESLQTSAQLTQVFEVDMTRVAQLRSKVKEEFSDTHGVKLSFLPFYAKAVVEALVSHPNVNASFDEEAGEITYHASVHLGIAVDTESGLLSPVIHDAQDLDVAGLAKAIVEIARKARDGKLTPDDLQGGTFTLTNIGSEGALFDTPILVPPQAAMLGTGAIVRRPVVDTDADGESIAIRSMGYLPLTYDHRLIDGADAGRFLTTVCDRLRKGEFAGELGL